MKTYKVKHGDAYPIEIIATSRQEAAIRYVQWYYHAAALFDIPVEVWEADDLSTAKPYDAVALCLPHQLTVKERS